MPYSLPDNIPDYIKNLPQGAQRIFVDVFNSAIAEDKSEEEARQAAWGAVKNAYEKRGEEWVKKAKEADMDKTLAEAYAEHNQLHLDFANVQLGSRRKAEIQGKHSALVGDILASGGVHMAKDKDTLDETLPQELRGTIKARYVAPIGVATMTMAEEGASTTSRIQVLRTGTFYHPVYGKFTVTENDLANMVQNFKLKRPKEPTEMVVDYEHMSAPGSAPQTAPAAGWVKACEQDGAELFCFVEWTAKAADAIRNKEYRFISPEFTLNYRDKESNKSVGPTLLALALTNRPFMEGMEPVVLSDEVAEVLVLSEGAIQNYTQFDKAEEALAAGTAVDASILLADWDTQYINDLPDEAFALIRPGGEKDERGKTVPRSLRFLPYKNMDGSINLPHLRNALARLDQTSLTPEEKAKARSVLEKAAEAEGVGEEEKPKSAKEVLTLDEAKIRELLGIGAEDSIEEAITVLKAKAAKAEAKAEEEATKAEAAQQQLSERQAKDTKDEAIALVDKAITDKKLLPKQKDAAVAMCLKDKEGFVALVDVAPEVGPDPKEKGNAGNNLEVVITATEKAIAARMGVSDEALQKVKEADVAAAPAS